MVAFKYSGLRIVFYILVVILELDACKSKLKKQLHNCLLKKIFFTAEMVLKFTNFYIVKLLANDD